MMKNWSAGRKVKMAMFGVVTICTVTLFMVELFK